MTICKTKWASEGGGIGSGENGKGKGARNHFRTRWMSKCSNKLLWRGLKISESREEADHSVSLWQAYDDYLPTYGDFLPKKSAILVGIATGIIEAFWTIIPVFPGFLQISCLLTLAIMGRNKWWLCVVSRFLISWLLSRIVIIFGFLVTFYVIGLIFPDFSLFG